MAAEPSARKILRCDGGEVETVPLAFGRAAFFSRRSPDKESDNEDAALLVSLADERGVLAVADGMGGGRGGAEAAEIAVACLAAGLARPDLTADLRGVILDAVEAANQKIIALGIGSATTLCIAELAPGQIRTYHVGDSAALVTGQRGRVKLQTIAHSPVGYAVESGLLAEKEAMVHDERHIVSNVLGNADMRVEIGSSRGLARRDRLVVGSDGLFDNMSSAEIVETIRTGPVDRAAEALARICSERMQDAKAGGRGPSKPDDLTLIVFGAG